MGLWTAFREGFVPHPAQQEPPHQENQACSKKKRKAGATTTQSQKKRTQQQSVLGTGMREDNRGVSKIEHHYSFKVLKHKTSTDSTTTSTRSTLHTCSKVTTCRQQRRTALENLVGHSRLVPTGIKSKGCSSSRRFEHVSVAIPRVG